VLAPRPVLLTALIAWLALPSVASASPFSPAVLDTTIENCLQDMDADSLWNYIQALQDFTTRHSNSDTVSTTTGVGAARRWVHDKFLEFAAQGGNVTASYHNYTATISGINKQHRNVVGEIPGTAPPSERRLYVIGGHLDSRNEDVDDSTGTAYGADDDASGIACLLECARVMSLRSWPHTFRFVAFTGEEQGLIGSAAYARDVLFSGESVAAMLNNDTMASIMGMPSPDSTVVQVDTTLARVFAQPPEEGPDRQFQRYLKAMGDAYVPTQQIVLIPAVDRPGRGGDHESFLANGFTAIRYMEYLEETFRQHTTDGDTLGPHLDRNYLRRNARVDAATLGNLGLAPAPPTGMTAGDVGDSTGFRVVWPTTNTEPDLAGYVVTQRLPGSLDYDAATSVGIVNELVTAALGDSVYFGLAAVDSGGHPSLILNEQLAVLSSLPAAPVSPSASPDGDSILLTWSASPEADLLGYHVYRSVTQGSGYVAITGSPVSSPAFDDAGVAAQTRYYYVITAVDSSANESGFSTEVSGQLVSLDAGVLFVDETKDGTNAWFPTEAAADSVYAAMMPGAHDVWDVDVDGIPTLSDLGPYSSVIWVADDFTSSFMGSPVITQLLPSATGALAEYMALGGNVMVTGWETAGAFDVLGSYPFDLSPGDFLYDWFGVDDVRSKGPARFKGGVGQGAFPSVGLEPARLNGNWSGKLIRTEGATALRPGTAASFRFDSDEPDSSYHDLPCGTHRAAGTHRAVWWGFPLYHLATADAQAALTAVLTFFGEIDDGTVDAPVVAHSGVLSLGQNRPNPFASRTSIEYSVAGERARVDLSLFDLAGRRVRTLVSGPMPAGRHEAVWEGVNDQGRRVASGVYFYRLTGEDRTFTKKLVFLR